MKKSNKSKIIVITFGFVFACSILFVSNFNNYQEINENLEEAKPKIAGYWNLTPFVIDDNGGGTYTWLEAVNQPWCSGAGTWDNPYLIENITINGMGLSSCITIRDSIVPFRIENCTFYNSSSALFTGGIKLQNVNNGRIINCNCSNNNEDGIYLQESDNNIISGNIISNNLGIGIQLRFWNVNTRLKFNTISNNIINNNWRGINFINSDDNNIIENTLSHNNDWVFHLSDSNNNKIINNNFTHNSAGIEISSTFSLCENNVFFGNNVSNNDDRGVIANADSENNLFYGNFFGWNLGNAYDYGINNDWDNGSLGNYWQNYYGEDIDDDGIGDTPYNISGSAGSQDNYPIWYDPPDIIIFEPDPNDFFGNTAPNFNVSITDPNLNSTWYILGNDQKKYIFSGTSGAINQTSWNEKEDGSITITFYANDTARNIASKAINIEKDTTLPVIIIDSPPDNSIFSRSPDYNVTIIEDNFESSWYTIEGIAATFLFTGLTGSINQDAWDDAPKGEINITFYVIDRAGNIGSKSVVVIKRIPSKPEISGYNLFFLLGILSVAVIILSKKLKKY